MKKKGSILLAVFAGKFSEGIDFKDDLCRCTVLVGLPYPFEDNNLKLKK